ncbi:MAG: hypothetical protein R2822_07845 [Spirosomataceae bacterium]
MIRLFALLLLFCWSLLTQAQQILDNKALFLKQNSHHQTYLSYDGRYLALDVFRMGRIKRHRFFVGDEFTFKLKHHRKRYRENIVAISDSSFTFSEFNSILNEAIYTEVKLEEVRKVKTFKRIPWVTQGAYMLPLAGGIFLLTDTFIYRGGLDFQFNFDPKTALIAGGIASLGVVCAKLSFPTYRVGKKNQH